MCARRNALLASNERFYCWQLVRDKHAKGNIEAMSRYFRLFLCFFERVLMYVAVKIIFQRARDIAKAQTGYTTDISTVTIFGELFGGNYPHPDVQDLGFPYVHSLCN